MQYLLNNQRQPEVGGQKSPRKILPKCLTQCTKKQTEIYMPNFIARFEFGFAFAVLWVCVFCWKERQTNRISLESVLSVCLSSSLFCVCSPMFAARWRVSKGALPRLPSSSQKEVRCSVQEFLIVEQLWHAHFALVHKTPFYFTLKQCCVSLLRVRVAIFPYLSSEHCSSSQPGVRFMHRSLALYTYLR